MWCFILAKILFCNPYFCLLNLQFSHQILLDRARFFSLFTESYLRWTEFHNVKTKYEVLLNFCKRLHLNFFSKICFQDIVMKLRIIIHWLMGSPAGLKLNAPLTNLLGQFYLYHVNLWWSFLGK